MFITITAWAWAIALTTRSRLTERLSAAQRDERGSPTLETVVIAAGLLALAAGLVAAIAVAVQHYSANIH